MWTDKVFHCVYMRVSKKQHALSPKFTFNSTTWFLLFSSYPVSIGLVVMVLHPYRPGRLHWPT